MAAVSRDYPTVEAVLTIVEGRLRDPLLRDGLSRVEADLLATVSARGLIGNGGLVTWYEGKNARLTDKVASSFERIGLPALAAALRASMRAFPGGAPSEELTARRDYVASHRAELEQAFRELDEIFWDADWEAAAMAYIDAHRAELAAIAPRYAAALRLQ